MTNTYRNEHKKRRILIAVIILTILPVFFAVRLPGILTVSATAQYIAALLGYFGLAMLLWQFVLGSKAFFTTVFHDPAPIWRIHSLLGKYGTLLIFAHPLFILLSYSENLFYIFVPDVSSYFESHVTLGRIALYILLMIWISSAVLRDKIAHRPWKYIHYLAYISLPFALLHVPGLGTNFNGYLPAQIYYYSIVVLLCFTFFIRIGAWLNIDRTKYLISQVSRQNNNVVTITLNTASTTSIAPRPGQYVYLKLGIVSEDHPFSVVHYDKDSGDITLACRIVGSFTRVVSELKAGQSVFLAGPYGTFTAEVELQRSRPAIFIAGGIGITPFVSHIMAGRCEHLFYANRTPETSIFSTTLSQKLGNKMTTFYSEKATSRKEDRYISAQIIRETISDPRRYDYYICGPEQMMKATESMLDSLDISKSQIHLEKFST